MKWWMPFAAWAVGLRMIVLFLPTLVREALHR